MNTPEITRDYGHDVQRFNSDHNWLNGCELARTPGSSVTECDTHHAYVSHDVPELLRDV